jgi:hypothetical protein
MIVEREVAWMRSGQLASHGKRIPPARAVRPARCRGESVLALSANPFESMDVTVVY